MISTKLSVSQVKEPSVLPQAKRKQRIADHDADVLLAVGGETHRACGDGRAEICLPEQLSVPGIERVARAVAAAAEKHVGGGGQDSGFGGRRRLAVVPLLFARLR